jgi:EmrB/QacA subfamily drug resistance transporter
MFMIAVDTTVVNLALPLIGAGLHAPVAGLQWTIAAYTITTASLMLTSGSIGDRFGRRTVLQAGLAVFTLGSAGCSVAPDAGWLIACRALQGAGGSALTPMAMGVLTATFADPAARTRAIGLWSGTFGVGMAVGPTLGGVLAAAWGWRSLFWVTILPGAVSIIVAGLVIPDSRADRPRRLDPPGQLLVIAFLACLTYGIIEGPSAGWRSAPSLAVFASSAATLAAFVAWERRCANPLIDLRVFRSVPFSGALVITLSSFACLSGFLFLTTLYLQDVHGLNVLRAGVQLIPLAAATAVAGPAAGRVMGRSGARGPLAFAGVTLAVSCLVLTQAPSTAPWAFLAAAYVVFGAGYGAVNTVISAVAQAGMPRAQAGVAGGVTSAGRQAGQSLGVSVTGAIFAGALHGSVRDGFAAASHPAWLVIAACGFAVLPLGLVSTSRRALRTAALAAAPADHHPAGAAGARSPVGPKLPRNGGTGTSSGVRVRRRAGELATDLVRVRMAQVVEDGEGLLPGLPGLRQVAGGVTGVAEVGENLRFKLAVAEFPGDAKGTLVTGGGLGKVAQMVLGVAQAVPASSLKAAVPVCSAHGERLLAERPGLLVVAEQAVAPADVV